MNRIVLGAIAGAAGTIALDMVSYADMAVRGRPPSTMPAEVVRRIAEKAGIDSLAKPDGELDDGVKNRRTALGSLSGYAVGLTIGAFYGLASPLFSSVPGGARALIAGSLAMAASDVPATSLQATDPKTWGAVGWASDIIPHLAYGIVTALVFDAIASDA